MDALYTMNVYRVVNNDMNSVAYYVALDSKEGFGSLDPDWYMNLWKMLGEDPEESNGKFIDQLITDLMELSCRDEELLSWTNVYERNDNRIFTVTIIDLGMVKKNGEDIPFGVESILAGQIASMVNYNVDCLVELGRCISEDKVSLSNSFATSMMQFFMMHLNGYQMEEDVED